MSNVAIKKAHGETAVGVVVEEANTLADEIRKRAFELFVDRGRVDGFSLDNWFTAERDLIQVPEAHLVDRDGSFHLHVAVPGFSEKDLKVTAMPDALIVSAESKHKHSSKEADLHLCAFGEKRMFRRFDLPAGIDTDKVHARLDDGLLKITALKLEQEMPKAVAVSAA